MLQQVKNVVQHRLPRRLDVVIDFFEYKYDAEVRILLKLIFDRLNQLNCLMFVGLVLDSKRFCELEENFRLTIIQDRVYTAELHFAVLVFLAFRPRVSIAALLFGDLLFHHGKEAVDDVSGAGEQQK